MSKAAAKLIYGPQKRKGFSDNGDVKCESCFRQKLELDRLREEIKDLKRKLKHAQQREVIPLGAHTAPSQKFKKKATAEDTAKRGGAVLGHKGVGRPRIERASAITEDIAAPETCPECRIALYAHGVTERGVYDVADSAVQKKLYLIERRRCPCCRKVYENKPQVLPRSLYSNALLSKAAVTHYGHGVPMGRVCEMLGPEIKLGGVLGAMQKIAKLWEPALPKLIEEYRSSSVKHADETGWRVDGQPGWSWLFCSPTVSIFECQDSRSAKTPRRILGDEPLPGTLVVDRYAGYNKMPCKLQYCYAHLLREIKKLDDEFADNAEVISFCVTLGDLLSAAMSLQGQSLTDKEYYKRALEIVQQIKHLSMQPTKHLGIQSVQRIFSKREDRLFQWALDRTVPCHNNRAERELRQTVIARKVSFGSQSENGAKARSTLMSIIATAKKRLGSEASVERWLAGALTRLALEDVDPASLLPPVPT